MAEKLMQVQFGILILLSAWWTIVKAICRMDTCFQEIGAQVQILHGGKI